MHAYRELCSREWLHPSMPVEELLRLVLENGSALGFLGLARVLAKMKAEGVNAYVYVLLDWYTLGKRFFHSLGKDEAPIEGLPLEALKQLWIPSCGGGSKSTYCQVIAALP